MTDLKILLVDDDPNIRQLIVLYLKKEGYTVIEADRGDTALKVFQTSAPDLVLLDWMLPGMDGLEVCRTIRATSTTPIIMLTAKDDTFDKVLGLEMGADDYIVKPFEMKELVARIKAVTRRFQNAETESVDDEIRYNQLSINLEQYTVTYEGRELEMPPKELELLHYLAAHKGQVFTREQLLQQVWGYDIYCDTRTVDVHVKRIREKLPESEKYGWQIRTVWGVGYKFEVK